MAEDLNEKAKSHRHDAYRTSNGDNIAVVHAILALDTTLRRLVAALYIASNTTNQEEK